MTAPAPRQLAREMADLRRRLEKMERASQMSRRSIEGGGVRVYDPDGTLRGTIGLQPDGTTALTTINDPVPPTPEGPALTPVVGGIEVQVFGGFLDGSDRPKDVKGFEVHAYIDADYVPTGTTLRAFVTDPGTVTLTLPAGLWSICVVAVTTGGTRSAPSVMATESALPVVTDADLNDVLATANGKNKITWSLNEPPVPPGSGNALGDIWFRRNAANSIIGQWEWTTSGWASRTVSDAVIANLNVGKLVAGFIAAGEAIQAGEPTGHYAEMWSGGFRFFAPNPDGQVEEAGSFGTTADGLSLRDTVTGRTQVSLTRSGLSVPSLVVSGTDTDGDGAPDTGFQVYGREWLDWMRDGARGLIALGYYQPADGFVTTVSTSIGIGEISFVARAGRAYRCSFEGFTFASSAGTIRALATIRGTQDGTTPTISNGVVYDSKIVNIPAPAQPYSPPPITFTHYWSMTQDVHVRILYVAERLSGDTAGSVFNVRTYTPAERFFAPARWAVEDIGFAVADSLQLNDGGGAAGAPAASKQTYTTTWQSNWVASYLGSGSKRTDTTDLMQGYTSYYAAGGNQRGLTGLSGHAASYSTSASELSKTVVQALSGATIQKVEVKLHCNHSNSTAGGTAEVGYHTSLNAPSSPPSAAYGIIKTYFKRGETKWITLPSSTYDDWKSGNYRGITTGPNGDYMRFDGAGTDRPALRITYTR